MSGFRGYGQPVQIPNRRRKAMRPKLRGELRERVAEAIIDRVRKHPGKQVPATQIAEKFGLLKNQVSCVTLNLAKEGRLERKSRLTYILPELPHGAERPTLQELPLPSTVVTLPVSIIELAKDFYWQTNSNSLKEFIAWAEERLT